MDISVLSFPSVKYILMRGGHLAEQDLQITQPYLNRDIESDDFDEQSQALYT